MANTTFKGPVTSLQGFIGGANVNAGDTQQGGKVAWTVSTSATVQIASGPRSGETLGAANNDGLMIYVADGASGSAIYAFSDGTSWKRVDTNTDIET